MRPTTRSAQAIPEARRKPWEMIPCPGWKERTAGWIFPPRIFSQWFLDRLKAAFGDVPVSEEHPLEAVAISARDGGEYALEVAIGEKTVSGEEFRNGLELPSACLYLKEVEGKIRIVTKGLGHGLGMSQYGANVLAKEGSGYRDILNYYFKNIEISD